MGHIVCIDDRGIDNAMLVRVVEHLVQECP